jgi:hypothetical protein
LLNPGENQKGVDAERLAALERNAPAFIILDFRCVCRVFRCVFGSWECFLRVDASTVVRTVSAPQGKHVF